MSILDKLLGNYQSSSFQSSLDAQQRSMANDLSHAQSMAMASQYLNKFRHLPRPMVWEDIEGPCYDQIRIYQYGSGPQWLIERKRIMVEGDL